MDLWPSLLSALRHPLPGERAALRVAAADLRAPVRRARPRRLVLFLVDTSGSMGARRRMELTKGEVLSQLRTAYVRRDQAALMTFRGEGAELILPPTNSVNRAERLLRGLPTGGRTPLAAGLRAARGFLLRCRRASPGLALTLVVVTDGRANCASGTEGPLAAALAAARAIAVDHIASIVVDTEEVGVRLGLAGELAAVLGGPCVPLGAAFTGRADAGA